MEGRLMLSATTPEVAPQVSLGSYAVDVVGNINPAAGQLLRLNGASDGGYILFDGTTSSWAMTDSIGHTNSQGTIITRSDLDARGELFTGGADGSVHLSGFGSNGGLQPVVIVFPNNGDTGAATNTPLVVTPPENSVGSTEGGAIPIHSVLAGVRAEAAAGSHQAIPTLASRDPVAAYQARAVAAPSSRALSGEWGRAVVFELAGGEPESGERSAVGDRGSQIHVGETTTQVDGPLSIKEGRRDAGKDSSNELRGSRRDGAPSDGGSQGEIGEHPRTQAAADFGGVHGRRSDTAQDGTDSSSITRATEASSPPAVVAFEQFGDEAASVESAGAPWWRSSGLAPFLLALALERITARRSRRPQTEAPSR
jgi:hypothetical protein